MESTKLSSALRKLVWRQQRTDFAILADYQYAPITNPRQIRVLILNHGTVDDEVSCSLQHISLDKSTKFEALSYAWGDASQRRAIECGKSVLLVTVNLHGALRHLRYPHKKRIL
jgi:hypothetical protein